MNLKLIGGVLLVTGTCIGAGMLALPVATAQNDLISSSLIMLICWFIMTVGALYLLETNLRFPPGINMVNLAKQTLGKFGAAIAWLTTLLLFYALLSAYITGGMQITQAWLSSLFGLNVSAKLSTIIFTIIMATIVLRGIRFVDYSNRALMTLKASAMVLLIFAILPHAQWPSISFGTPHKILSAATVMITSFGFASIIPSLYPYFKDEIPALKKTIIMGSIIPLIIYLLWVFAVHATLPPSGSLSLTAMQESGNASSQLASSLIAVTHSEIISLLAHIFTSICVLTSFLGVGLILSDFLEDGTGISKKTAKGLSINAALVFILPMLIAMFYPKAFITALSYAGIFCVVLLMLLPILMAYAARKKFTQKSSYEVPGGNHLIFGSLALAIVALILSLLFL
ncbi:MAG: tyrP [Gammaproteobacteria bacterium]|jgi:tyrosine-specific transport protein|nr:tyrP [Gammaproteobacteria bacterium]